MGSRNTFLVLSFLIILFMTSVFAQPRIAGGQRGHLAQYKFVVALEMKTFMDGTDAALKKCTGSLLSESWVLSAAHCLMSHVIVTEIMGKKNGGRTLVLAGDLDSENAFTSQTTTGQMRLSYKNYTHPDSFDLHNIKLMAQRIPDKDFDTLIGNLTKYFKTGLDLALFQLHSPFSFGTDIASIKLAKYYNSANNQLNCVAIGFGNKNSSHETKRDLNYIPVTIGGIDYCNSLGHRITFNESYHICARGKKPFQNICPGDSGGPLACGPERYPQFLYGVGSTVVHGGVKDYCGKSNITTAKYIFPNYAADWIGWITYLVDFVEPTSEADNPNPAHVASAPAPASCGPFLAFEAKLFALVVFKSSWDIINY